MMDENQFWAMIEASRSAAAKKGLVGDAVLDDQI
jgi:hypothetical protein